VRRRVTVRSTRPRATRPWTSRRISTSLPVSPRGSLTPVSKNRWLSERASATTTMRAPRASARSYPLMLTTRSLRVVTMRADGVGRCQRDQDGARDEPQVETPILQRGYPDGDRSCPPGAVGSGSPPPFGASCQIGGLYVIRRCWLALQGTTPNR